MLGCVGRVSEHVQKYIGLKNSIHFTILHSNSLHTSQEVAGLGWDVHM